MFEDDIDFYIVSRELHKEPIKEHESPYHLHVYLKTLSTGKRYYFKDLDLLTIEEKRGNYSRVKKKQDWIKYIIKDGDFKSCNIDPILYLKRIKQKKSTKADLITNKLMDGDSPDDLMINPKFAGYMLMHSRKVYDFHKKLKHIRENNIKRKFFIPIINPITHPADAKIASWLKKNIFTERQIKQKQLWIYGPTNMGKSTFVMHLRKMLRIYMCDNYSNFLESFDNYKYDLIIFDEFVGCKRIGWMNQLVDGTIQRFDQKGTSIVKTQNLPVIVLSNFPPSVCWKNALDNKVDSQTCLETIQSRYLLVEVKKPISLYHGMEWGDLPLVSVTSKNRILTPPDAFEQEDGKHDSSSEEHNDMDEQIEVDDGKKIEDFLAEDDSKEKDEMDSDSSCDNNNNITKRRKRKSDVIPETQKRLRTQETQLEKQHSFIIPSLHKHQIHNSNDVRAFVQKNADVHHQIESQYQAITNTMARVYPPTYFMEMEAGCQDDPINVDDEVYEEDSQEDEYSDDMEEYDSYESINEDPRSRDED